MVAAAQRLQPLWRRRGILIPRRHNRRISLILLLAHRVLHARSLRHRTSEFAHHEINGPTEWESQMCDAPLIVLLPEAPMTPAIAGRAPPLGPSAWEGPSVSEE
jgi:hypothetical protein